MVRLDVLGGGFDALPHHLLDGAEADDAAVPFGRLHLEVQDAAMVVADTARPMTSPTVGLLGSVTCCSARHPATSGRSPCRMPSHADAETDLVRTRQARSGAAVRGPAGEVRMAKLQDFFEIGVGHLARGDTAA